MPVYSKGQWAIGSYKLSDGSVVYHVYNIPDAQSGPNVYLIRAVSLQSATTIVNCLAEHTI